MPKLYEELASWWPLLSSPADYAEEAAFYGATLAAACRRPPVTVLELGSGGGNNASHLKARFSMTLVDAAPGMLAESQSINPECEHVAGDMRTVRLGRQFDAVFVHDAVSYMTTESDLRQAIDTAFVHCRPGGAALFAPDFVRENFRPSTDHGGHDNDDGRGLRYLSWAWDPDPSDTKFVTDYAYLLRSADGSVRAEHDRHLEGLFSRDVWLGLLGRAGFEATPVAFRHSEVESELEVFVAARPGEDRCYLPGPGPVYPSSPMRTRGPLSSLCIMVAALATMAASSAPVTLTRGDLRWLARVTFGIDSAAVARYRQLGREKFLDEQLHPPSAEAASLASAIAAIPAAQQTAEARLKAQRAEQQRINTLPNEEDKQKARMALNQGGNQAVYETAKRDLIRALASPSQLREQMTWFWMNHFSVFSGKGNVRWTLAEYEEQTVRSHALGKFSDLVMATALSPAMLEYLDNAQSAAGKINENYARELMELHTLGVSGGPSGSAYTQQDVQELARVLTGAGLNLSDNTPRLPPNQQALYVRTGLFEFNPARHDAAPKTVLGHPITSKGLAEIEDAVVLLCRQPATARFISRKLATYFIADEPPAALVERMARTFQKTDGSIAAVLRDLFLDRDVSAALNAPVLKLEKFKDPFQFVLSSLRLAYDGKLLSNYRPVVGWLTQLGEPLYGKVTPDGYALTEAAWTSSGQMIRRFEIARALGSGNAGLFNNEDSNTPGPATGFPMLTSRLFYDAIEPGLSAPTRAALARTSSQQEWNTILLSSPDWMQR